MIGLAGFTLLGRDRAGTHRDVQHRKVGQLRTQGRDKEQVDAANSAAACGLLVVVRWSGPVVIVFEKFCNIAFDFENANLSKKKLRHTIEQKMTEFEKFVEKRNTPGYKDRNFRILTDFLTEPGKSEELSSDELQFLYTRLVFGELKKILQKLTCVAVMMKLT